jgi:hypothetical protein
MRLLRAIRIRICSMWIALATPPASPTGSQGKNLAARIDFFKGVFLIFKLPRRSTGSRSLS